MTNLISRTYLVGGYVRDQLLGIASHDKDYVVVGSTPNEMIAQGFEQVGADFPVFLHPETKEEYALARTERKCGVGYKGFTCDFNPNIAIDGVDYICLDKKLLKKFQEAGFNIHDEYTVDELTQAFRHIIQSNAHD